ncbi:MAG: HEAT repeat domain-containing protein, partial [Gemmataceae bacterium]|nr:HEAT repeat domain-containing protein [Gemmataceae bacterium]
LHKGYGVHVAFIGHDLHGLVIGPDGKLYFSIGDRGAHVETARRVLSTPDTGAVFRCNLDGSELEIFATGLRNPQELAFDKYGNLFTGDNNADGGDSARWVYVVPGGDSGWRIGFQYMKNLGPWNSEKMWHLAHEHQPAHLIPPLAHIANGPSGLTYHPGVSLLPERWKDHFFLADFRGSSGNSGIQAFTLKPKGASFEVTGRQQFLWSLLATDCDFGPDGGFYISDWVDGWGLTNKGRIYKLLDPKRSHDAQVLEVKQLLGEGMAKHSSAELARLLEHADKRVRQEAQFALAERKDWKTLAEIAKSGGQLARLHAIRGMGQVMRKAEGDIASVFELLQDADPEVRAQAAKVLIDFRHVKAPKPLQNALKDESPRVRFFAALALGSHPQSESMPSLVAFAKANSDDPFLRHAAVMGLAGVRDKEALMRAGEDPSANVRLTALLAMRRRYLPEVAQFLRDSDPKLVLEAARAIYDSPIPDAMPQLANVLGQTATLQAMPADLQDPFLLRVLNAQARLGKKENAQALAAFAASRRGSEKVRLEALEILGQWEKPSGRDRVVGLWRPIEPRDKGDAAQALRPALAGILTSTDKIRAEGARLAARLGIKEVGPVLRQLALDRTRGVAARIEALRALDSMKDKGIGAVLEEMRDDANARIRAVARDLFYRRAGVEEAVAAMREVLEKGEMAEKQAAFVLLADLKNDKADELLAQWLDRLIQKQAPAELHLDILEAARRRPTTKLQEKTKAFDAAAPADPKTRFQVALAGGDADSGRKVYWEKAELSCVRCHKLGGQGGEVGPDLGGISKKYKREYLWEALVHPNKDIAKGYETLVVVLTNGQVKSGILKSEDAKEVRLITAEGQSLTIPKEQIEERSRGPSAMPADLCDKMTLRELRDLVEYLANQ